MGREIRSVPPDWEHPKDRTGHYKPLFDQSYGMAAEEWQKDFLAFLNDPAEQAQARNADCSYFLDWHGSPPDKEYYRPNWDEGTDTAFQMYETVTEGTPVSPVFATLDDLKAWLIEQGHSEHAASEFCKHKWAPSMMFSAAGLKMGVDTFDD